MLAFSVGMVAYSYQNESFMWDTQKYFQIGISSVGAMWLFIMPSFAKLKPLLALAIMKITGNHQKDKVMPKEVTTPEYDTTDFKALTYLKNRCQEMGSERGFDIVVELNTILFSGSDTKIVEGDNEQSTGSN